ncbi:hypothetical protein GCM10009721_06170 [Terrabacter tumescens]|uniref:Uncharacterized protein n=1 Tax=Terrabacter tumescens TaxID=60443 RepID=A0ABQ2HL52_9MICO|nr:hypothetical protein GCM10009721_06170 [Terrabacter tumescens]
MSTLSTRPGNPTESSPFRSGLPVGLKEPTRPTRPVGSGRVSGRVGAVGSADNPTGWVGGLEKTPTRSGWRATAETVSCQRAWVVPSTVCRTPLSGKGTEESSTMSNHSSALRLALRASAHATSPPVRWRHSCSCRLGGGNHRDSKGASNQGSRWAAANLRPLRRAGA